jgi:hypothetical protein
MRSGDPLEIYPEALRRKELMGEVLEKKKAVLPVVREHGQHGHTD